MGTLGGHIDRLYEVWEVYIVYGLVHPKNHKNGPIEIFGIIGAFFCEFLDGPILLSIFLEKRNLL